MKNNDNNYSLKEKFLKLWILFVLIFTSIIILICIFYNKFKVSLYKRSISDYNIFTSIIPGCPPPLINFTD